MISDRSAPGGRHPYHTALRHNVFKSQMCWGLAIHSEPEYIITRSQMHGQVEISLPTSLRGHRDKVEGKYFFLRIHTSTCLQPNVLWPDNRGSEASNSSGLEKCGQIQKWAPVTVNQDPRKVTTVSNTSPHQGRLTNLAGLKHSTVRYNREFPSIRAFSRFNDQPQIIGPSEN